MNRWLLGAAPSLESALVIVVHMCRNRCCVWTGVPSHNLSLNRTAHQRALVSTRRAARAGGRLAPRWASGNARRKIIKVT